MSKFYFDEYNSVQAEDFEGQAVFVDGNTETLVMFFNGSCKLPFDISLRKHYKIRTKNTEHEIEYRFIVHTEKFENENTYNGDLGVVYTKEYTDFYLWAPTAFTVKLNLIDTSNNNIQYNMDYKDKGVYHIRVKGDVERFGYYYLVEHQETQRTLDPYGISSAINSQYNFVIDKSKITKSMQGKSIVSKRDAIVYEVNVRDFSSDKDINFKNSSKYCAMTQKGLRDKQSNKVGLDYILDLGITHIQLMPIYDYGSIDERESSVDYNWGYDPVQFNVPEGKYSINPNDPYSRINELVELVNVYHQEGIGVIMDVVYNHVYNEKTFSFAQTVPYYFFRYKGNELSNASFCGNETASERTMVRRFIVNSIEYLTKTFGFDGYRFDLMGILDYETINKVYEKVFEINPNIYIYGEGWTMPTAIYKEECATQQNFNKMSEIGFFNDDFRNTCKQVMIGQLNSHKLDIIKPLLLGIDYNKPENSLQYISCHDDYTIFDQIYYDYQKTENVLEIIKRAYVYTFLSQGNPFLHSGCEAMRTKLGIKNSYNYSEEINKLDWSLMNKNIELVNFVKELIRVRKLEEFYLCKNSGEIMDKISVSLEDNYILYKLEKLTIYINLTQEKISVNVGAKVISKDGIACEDIKNTIDIEHYVVSQNN